MKSTITPQDLKAMLDNNEPLLLIDVRSQQERDAYHIGGEHIPLQQLPNHLSRMPTDRPIIIYCHSGVRSQSAVEYLDEAGFDNALNLIGGVVAWQAMEEKN